MFKATRRTGVRMPMRNDTHDQYPAFARLADAGGSNFRWDYAFYRNPFITHAVCAKTIRLMKLCTGGAATGGIAHIPFFILPALLFVVASYRPERSVDVSDARNGLAWIITILPWSITGIQALVCGIAILCPAAARPVFAGGLGCFNRWLAVLLVPGALIPLVRAGPFAWDGLLTMFGLWYLVMQADVLKAIRSEDPVAA